MAGEMVNSVFYKAGSLWDGLSEEQKKEVLASESEIGDESAWVSHEEMKRRNSKWLSESGTSGPADNKQIYKAIYSRNLAKRQRRP